MIQKARTLHKWLMRLVGVQFILWGITGLYMVCLDIHFIHGEPLTHPQSTPLQLNDISYSTAQLLADYPDATDIKLVTLLQKPVYRFRSATGQRAIHVVDAITGAPQDLLSQAQARQIADNAYTGKAAINTISPLISRDASGALNPLWVVSFDDIASSTLYIEQQSGRIIRRRHNYWYLFDWMWRLHIMDYDDGENVTNSWLRLVSLLAVLAAVSGMALLLLRFTLRKKAAL